MQFWPPKDAHAIIPKTFECINLHGKSDFGNVIKVKNLDMMKLS